MVKFLRNLELWLSAAGIVVIWAVPSVFSDSSDDSWRIAAITALGVGTLHGIIFWLVRRRQRRVRNEAISEIRLMLKDNIYNQLNMIMLSVADTAPETEKEQLNEIKEAVRDISDLIQTLSEESLNDWQVKYGQTLEALRQYSANYS